MLLLATVLFASPLADAWTLNPHLEAGAKTAWNISVHMTKGSEEHSGSFKQTIDVTKTPGKDPGEATYAWSELKVDDNTMDDPGSWNLSILPTGGILGEKSGDDMRRMLSPLAFVYPGHPISVGDTWNTEIVSIQDSAKKFSYSYTVAGEETTEGTTILKIKEQGDDSDGCHVDGIWWFNKAGEPIKFQLKIRSWFVPMAGAEAFDAAVTGTPGKLVKKSGMNMGS